MVAEKKKTLLSYLHKLISIYDLLYRISTIRSAEKNQPNNYLKSPPK